MKSALITGGAGFVGRHLTHKLLMNGWAVKVVDSITPGSGGISPLDGWPIFDPRDYGDFTFENIDCREYFKTNDNMEFDYLFHLAAIVGGRLTIEKNPLAVATDLSIDAEMWNWAAKSSIGKVVHFSSSAAYPIEFQTSNSEIVSLKEDLISFKGSIGLPDLTYGWSKITSEYLGKIAFERYGIKSITYRPFSGYGIDQHSSYPFPGICERAIESRGNSEFIVWGNGLQSRDFIHIDDCIDGIILTMDKIDNGDALNLSTGIPTSFIKFATVATNLLGYNPKINGDSSMPTGVQSRVGNTDKQRLYGFTAKKPFEIGVKECLDYFLRQKK